MSTDCPEKGILVGTTDTDITEQANLMFFVGMGNLPDGVNITFFQIHNIQCIIFERELLSFFIVIDRFDLHQLFIN